jgi:hypothetical protein
MAEYWSNIQNGSLSKTLRGELDVIPQFFWMIGEFIEETTGTFAFPLYLRLVCKGTDAAFRREEAFWNGKLVGENIHKDALLFQNKHEQWLVHNILSKSKTRKITPAVENRWYKVLHLLRIERSKLFYFSSLKSTDAAFKMMMMTRTTNKISRLKESKINILSSVGASSFNHTIPSIIESNNIIKLTIRPKVRAMIKEAKLVAKLATRAQHQQRGAVNEVKRKVRNFKKRNILKLIINQEGEEDYEYEEYSDSDPEYFPNNKKCRV